jgi:NAD(P)H-dependent flavin oxidoreductase YrpB (nitropropane dioxygenase family)
MTWNTPLAELFGARYPIMQAGIGQVAGGRLAQSLTDGPFGVDFLFPDIDESTGPTPDIPYHAVDPKLRNTMLNIAYDRQAALIDYAMKLQPGRADEAHERGIKVMTLVGTARHAVCAQERGADGVTSTGTEAGGHTGAVAYWS